MHSRIGSGSSDPPGGQAADASEDAVHPYLVDCRVRGDPQVVMGPATLLVPVLPTESS